MASPPHGAADGYYEQQQPTVVAPSQPSHQKESEAQPQPPPYTVNNGPPTVNEGRTFDQDFKINKPKWNDLWAGILLIITFLGFVAVSAISLQGYSFAKSFNGSGIYDSRNEFGLTTNTLLLFLFVLALAFVCSAVFFLLARTFTKQFIWIAGIVNIVVGLGTAAVYFARQYYSAAIVFLIFSVFYIICFISWIPRIPFSVIILQTVMDVSRHHGHMFTVSLLGGIVSAAFGAWFSITLTAIYVK
ncbi:MAG: putative choline transporter, neither null mutation nor overexpression affects choline transport [Caeruleum heppii]|nr:MAG: putative choline transporter, neither null mutation nor overexpression affects choline transport [Caeruleum heppii]